MEMECSEERSEERSDELRMHVSFSIDTISGTAVRNTRCEMEWTM